MVRKYLLSSRLAAAGHMSMADPVREYEKQMRPRAREAVETSRQAGLDGLTMLRWTRKEALLF